ncbi:MAG: DUF456 domain-containing protein [Alistipes sp.]|jgi:uncharacterized protein YqgC (DUF456 family)|nr:DUF456 domain-containing protein [Alistipes sp.]
MDITLAIVAFLLSLVGIIGCIVPILPGLVLNYIAILCLYFTSYAEIDLTSLIIWLVVVTLISLADFILPAWMTRKFGGSKAGEWGATIGVFAGLFLFPPFGVILGPFFGAILGEMSRKKNDPHQALKSGFGSFLAFIVGTGIKLIVAFWMTGVVIASCWSPVRDAIVSLFN